MLASLLYCLPYRVWGQDIPKEADKPSTFLLRFGTKEEIDKKEQSLSEDDRARYASLQKSIWLSAFGIDPDAAGPQEAKGFKTRVPEYLQKDHVVTTGPRAAAGPGEAPPPPASEATKAEASPKRRKVQVYTANGH